MSLFKSPEELEQWAGVLERRFVAAAQTEEAYVEAARTAHHGAVKWVCDDSRVIGSFLWVCDLLELEPDAVRREVAKGRA